MLLRWHLATALAMSKPGSVRASVRDHEERTLEASALPRAGAADPIPGTRPDWSVGAPQPPEHSGTVVGCLASGLGIHVLVRDGFWDARGA